MRVQTVQVVYAAEVVVYAAEVLTEQTLSLPNIQGLFSDQGAGLLGGPRSPEPMRCHKRCFSYHDTRCSECMRHSVTIPGDELP